MPVYNNDKNFVKDLEVVIDQLQAVVDVYNQGVLHPNYALEKIDYSISLLNNSHNYWNKRSGNEGDNDE